MRDSQIAAELEPVLTPFGLELETVEVMPAGKRRLLRVVLDGDGPEGRGPTLDEIAEATKAISTTLDASASVGNAPYTLEVSSRGISRPLEQPRHWRRNTGRLVQAQLASGEQVIGRITDSDGDSVLLQVGDAVRRIGFTDVTKALVQVEFNRPDPASDDTDESED